MLADEQKIRNLVTAWLSATKAGDAERMLSLMAGNVRFLMPGHPPMDKTLFAAV